MSDNNPAIYGTPQVVGLPIYGTPQVVSLPIGSIGIGSYIVNDYLITVAESEDGNGYTMTIKKGGQSQTIHLTELKQEYVNECIQTALTYAKNSGEFDGFSPIIEVARQGEKVILTITDAEGTKTEELYDGFTPTATVTKEADITSITIEDAEGSNTAYIRDGISPRVEVVRNESLTTLYVTDAYGTKESVIFDGAKGDKGDKGDTGVSITSAVLNSDYTLTIGFSDGSYYKTPNSIRGPQGIQGIQGPRGIQGLRGEKGLKGDKGDPGDSFTLHICTSTEYDPETRVPTIASPNALTMYLVPSEDPGGNDLFVEWVYVNRTWEMFGSASVDLSQYAKIDDTAGAGDTDKTWSASKITSELENAGSVKDVKINGTSIVDSETGEAEIPVATTTSYGAVRLGGLSYGIQAYGSSDALVIGVSTATNDHIKKAQSVYRVVKPSEQYIASFYGLAKAAGDTTQSQSSNAVGTYTEEAKSAISEMLGGAVSVTGTTPTINAKAGIRYICGEVTTLDITLPASGIVDVVFTSGSTPTVLTITPPAGQTVKWANGFDPTSLDAETTYEINIMNGLGVTIGWT